MRFSVPSGRWPQSPAPESPGGAGRVGPGPALAARRARSGPAGRSSSAAAAIRQDCVTLASAAPGLAPAGSPPPTASTGVFGPKSKFCPGTIHTAVTFSGESACRWVPGREGAHGNMWLFGV